jgi:hypothetical protein
VSFKTCRQFTRQMMAAMLGSAAGDDVADLHLDDVAPAQLAVDRQIEQHTVTQSSVLVEKKADRPQIAWFKRALRAHHVA